MRERCRRGCPQPQASAPKTERADRQSCSFSGPTRAKSLVFIPSAAEIFRSSDLQLRPNGEKPGRKKRCGSIKLLMRRQFPSQKSITHFQAILHVFLCEDLLMCFALRLRKLKRLVMINNPIIFKNGFVERKLTSPHGILRDLFMNWKCFIKFDFQLASKVGCIWHTY